MAAAPHLFDDPPISSPELALVDADLAAQLRAELSSGESFRPRSVPRPESPSLVFDAVVRELADEPPAVDEPEDDEPPVGESVEITHAVVPDIDNASRSSDFPVLATQEDESYELPDYIVMRDELPDYIVPRDDDVDVAPVSEDVALADEAPADVLVLGDLGPEDHDIVQTYVDQLAKDDDASSSDYPVLPDLDERSDALDETDAALRRIREQMGGGATPTGQRKRRVRRWYTVVTGLCAAAALAVYAAEVELGVVHAPSWLAF